MGACMPVNNEWFTRRTWGVWAAYYIGPSVVPICREPARSFGHHFKDAKRGTNSYDETL